MVIGGVDASGAAIRVVETWDPAGPRSVRSAPLPVGLADPAAVLLNDGNVLVTGGVTDTRGWTATGRAFVWNANRDVWSEVGPMSGARRAPSAVRLADGSVLIVGNREGGRPAACQGDDPACPGSTVSGDVAERFDPATGRFHPTPPSRQAHLEGHVSVRLADGRVAVFGTRGGDGAGSASGVVETYDPARRIWEDRGDVAAAAVRGMTATRLANGSVLVVGAVMTSTAGRRWRAARALDRWSPSAAPVVRPPRRSVLPREILEASPAS